MAINLASKFESKVAERFSQKSITDAYCGHDYHFTGVKTITVFSVDTVAMNDYTRSGANRYGTPTELGDTTQELTITKDRSFTYTIDKGNAQEQYNIKHANTSLKRQTDEVVTPEIDAYRLSKWAAGAGLSNVDGELDEATVLKAVFAGQSAMNNALVPLEGRVVFMRESVYLPLLLANQVVGLDSIGGKSIATGKAVTPRGDTVVPVPDSLMPTGVNFIIKYRGSTVDPVKLNEYKIHTDPPGISGALVEGRIIYDAFVLDAKKNGIYVSKSA